MRTASIMSLVAEPTFESLVKAQSADIILLRLLNDEEKLALIESKSSKLSKEELRTLYYELMPITDVLSKDVLMYLLSFCQWRYYVNVSKLFNQFAPKNRQRRALSQFRGLTQGIYRMRTAWLMTNLVEISLLKRDAMFMAHRPSLKELSSLINNILNVPHKKKHTIYVAEGRHQLRGKKFPYSINHRAQDMDIVLQGMTQFHSLLVVKEFVFWMIGRIELVDLAFDVSGIFCKSDLCFWTKDHDHVMTVVMRRCRFNCTHDREFIGGHYASILLTGCMDIEIVDCQFTCKVIEGGDPKSVALKLGHGVRKIYINDTTFTSFHGALEFKDIGNYSLDMVLDRNKFNDVQLPLQIGFCSILNPDNLRIEGNMWNGVGNNDFL